MSKKKNRAIEDDNDGSTLADLISDIRRSELKLPAAIQRRTGKTSVRPVDDHRGLPNCPCGKPKIASSPLCPECAYEHGYIDKTALDKNLAVLQGKANDKLCQCGNAKIPSQFTCKRCAIQSGRLEIMIGPEDMPCPDCGDGRKPRYTYCTACAKARGLLNSDGTIDAMCPTNRCSCGLTKAIAYSRCTICEANLREGLQEVRTENDTEKCERCSRPVNAAKRFCRRCMVEMGAPAGNRHPPVPRGADPRAENRKQAADAFNERIRLHRPEWRSHEIRLHLGDRVFAPTLDPPESEE